LLSACVSLLNLKTPSNTNKDTIEMACYLPSVQHADLSEREVESTAQDYKATCQLQRQAQQEAAAAAEQQQQQGQRQADAAGVGAGEVQHDGAERRRRAAATEEEDGDLSPEEKAKRAAAAQPFVAVRRAA
jgi:hypothetical protein